MENCSKRVAHHRYKRKRRRQNDLTQQAFFKPRRKRGDNNEYHQKPAEDLDDGVYRKGRFYFIEKISNIDHIPFSLTIAQ